MTDIGGATSLHVRWADSLADVVRETWDVMTGELGFYFSRSYLSMLEANAGARVRYLLVERAGVVVAGVPVHDVIDETLRNYRPDKHESVTGRGNWLLAGTRRAYRSGVAVHPGLSAEDRAAAMALVVDTLLTHAGSAGYDGVVWMYAISSAAAELVRCGATVGLANAEAVIPVPAGGLDAYLATFSPRRGREFRREMRVFRDTGHEITECLLSECWEEAGELLLNIQLKYGHESTLAAERASLRNQANALDEHSMVLRVVRDGRMVGFALMYRWSGSLYARVAGFDYAALRRSYEYFNVTYYHPIARMGDLGLSELHLGISAVDAKIARGAVLRPLWTVAVPVAGITLPPVDVHHDLQLWRERHPERAMPATEWNPSWLAPVAAGH